MRFLSLVAVVLLTGCAHSTAVHLASSQPSPFDSAVYGGTETVISKTTPVGVEEYRVFHQGATGFVLLDDVRNDAERRASSFCQRQDKVMRPLREIASQPPHILGNFPRIELIFSCADRLQGNAGTLPSKASTEPRILVSTGTGFAVSGPLTIATANHVIDEATSITLSCGGGQEVAANVIAVDQPNDLAVLRIGTPAPTYLELAPDRSLRVGERVFTVGFPVPDLLGTSAKYTDGSISSLTGLQDAASVLQITVPVQPGNSGGPLMNEAGQVVGVITSGAAVQGFLRRTGTLPQNVNWAVRSEYLRLLLPQDTRRVASITFAAAERAQKSVCLVRVTRSSK